MDPSASSSGSSGPVSWRGADVASDPWGDQVQGDADADPAAEAANARTRRNRRWAVLAGGGLLLAATVVTGTGGDDAAEVEDGVASSTALDSSPTDDRDVDDGRSGTDADSVPDTIDPVEGGLRYGGAGGGADIRAGDRDPSNVADLADVPFDTPWVAPRLPGAVEPQWSRTIPLGPALASTSRDLVLAAVDLAVGDDSVVVVVPADGDEIGVLGLDPADGTVRWNTAVEGASGRIVGIAGGLVGIDVGGPDERTLLLFDEVDGAPVAQNGERVARAQEELVERRASGRDVRPDTVNGRSFAAGVSGSPLVERLAEALDVGTATVLAAEEVAVGRLAMLVGNDLVGVRTEDGARFDGGEPSTSLLVDWVRPGVLLRSNPSDDGATLLISSRGGAQQAVLDAASGSVVTELSGLSSSFDVYTPATNGVLVKRAALVGSSLVAVDLDGRELWQLLGNPPFAVGDELVVTAGVGIDGVVVTGRG